MRASLKHEDGFQTGFGFQEGNVLIVAAGSTIFQFPPNKETGEESKPVSMVKLSCLKLNDDFSDLQEEEPCEIMIRAGMPDTVRPAVIALKDVDNMEAQPDVPEQEVGVEGNCFDLEPGKKIGFDWPAFEESLRKKGWKAEIAARGYLPDFVGTRLHISSKPTAYTKKDGTPGKGSQYVCDKIHTFGYDVKKGAKPATKAGTKAGAVAAAAGKAAAGNDDTAIHAKTVEILKNLSPRFRKAIPAGKEVPRAEFGKQINLELMTQRVPAQLNKAVQDLLKDDDKLMEIAIECEFVIDLGSDPQTVTL